MESNKVVLGVLAGVAVGALAGILFAPVKGVKTRKRIVSQARSYTDELQSKIEDMVDDVSEQYDTLLHDVQNANANMNHKMK
jgi:gas vesicle protein